MNRERIKGIITQLSKVPRGKFDMGSWFKGAVRTLTNREEPIANEKHACGTSACIAGWTLLLYSDKAPNANAPAVVVSEEAKGLLGLTSQQAARLFYAKLPSGEQIRNMNDITNQQAINTLERLLATGEVRWDLRNEPVT